MAHFVLCIVCEKCVYKANENGMNEEIHPPILSKLCPNPCYKIATTRWLVGFGFCFFLSFQFSGSFGNQHPVSLLWHHMEQHVCANGINEDAKTSGKSAHKQKKNEKFCTAHTISKACNQSNVSNACHTTKLF